MSQKSAVYVKGPILVCLDGSADSLSAGRLALTLAKAGKHKIVAAHIYDARIHEARFRQMEPGLPEKYQAEDGLKDLRESHTTLMTDGFEALSRGYLETFVRDVRDDGVQVETVVQEGRNYVGLLDIAGIKKPGLVAFGAAGLGDMGDGMVGSTASRLLHNLSCDILVGRVTAPETGPVLAGIDGSEAAINSMFKARSWSRALGTDLQLAAAYDPALHQHVFKAMADTMPEEAQTAVGLDRQQELHESLIDDGLGTLYEAFLADAARKAENSGPLPPTHLVADKGYRALVDKAGSLGARLICLGRFGHHHESISSIGSTSESVVRRTSTNVFIAGISGPGKEAEENAAVMKDDLPWDPEAAKRLGKVPGFVRKTAKRGVESLARSEGASRVTVDHFEQVASKFRSRRKGKN